MRLSNSPKHKQPVRSICMSITLSVLVSGGEGLNVALVDLLICVELMGDN